MTNDVTPGLDHLGAAAAPLVLLAGGPTMHSWPDLLCLMLASGTGPVERLSEPAIPTLVGHGRHDRFIPLGHGEVLACEVPAARLLVLERGATTIPGTDVDEVAAAMPAL